MKLRRAIWHYMRRRKKISPTRVVALGFLAVILLGALLLSLPAATRAPGGAPFLTALFTATSATCVTGLVLHDTFTYWSLFGQIVILALIQIGGLGLMTVVSILSFLLHRTIGLRERLLMVQALSLNDLTGVVRMVRHILFGTFALEGLGACVLSIRFVGEYGLWGGIYRGVFHSVSAFCNAGFDLMGTNDSLAAYRGDPLVCLPIMALIVIGGIGFFVWEDVYRKLRLRRRGLQSRLHVHTKLVVLISGVLIAFGAVSFLVAEYENPSTLGALPPGEKILASLFQSVTCRTAGFATLDQAALTPPSQLVSTLLMFVGGSPGSTAGGVKTVTLGVLVISAIAVMRGKSQATIFARGLSSKQVLASLSIAMVGFGAVVVSVTAMSLFESNGAFFPMVFEAVSAMGTVGLSMNLTATLTGASHVVLILLMYFGRVGLLTIGIALLLRRGGQSRVQFPESKLIIG